MVRISVIVLTKDEELHIARCIQSLGFSHEIFIVDSGSTDKTIEIASSLGAKVFANPWLNYASQFNWGLDNLPITGDWVMRMDADEYVTLDLRQKIVDKLSIVAEDISGFYVKRKVNFMGTWMRHGGYYPVMLLRIWRTGVGRCEERWMDEHVLLKSGSTVLLNGDIVDDNLNNLSTWTAKHNGYATREAIDLLNIKYGFSVKTGIDPLNAKNQESRKRWIKENVYSNLPIGLRALIYFLYRYILRLGFLDGQRGFVFHLLQGFWYRFLVDAKVMEVEKLMRDRCLDAKAVLTSEYGIKFVE